VSDGFELRLVMFCEGIRSRRQRIATASLHLAHRWSRGYVLVEAFPGHCGSATVSAKGASVGRL
jgi:hypothetical protein